MKRTRNATPQPASAPGIENPRLTTPTPLRASPILSPAAVAASSSQPANGIRRSAGQAAALLLLLLLTLLPGAAGAQTYFFEVPEMLLQVYVQPDGSARFAYDIVFENYGSDIDIVDIGVPHEDYQLVDFTASVDGQPVYDIRTSEYVKPGVEIHLHDYAIPSGQSGALHVEYQMPKMVYQDLTNRDWASLQVSPTWFDSSLITGLTDLEIAVHLPEGVGTDELRFQDEPFSDMGMVQGRAVADWLFPNTSLTGPHKVGVSFPKAVMTSVVDQNLLQLAGLWYEGSTVAQVVVGLGLLIAFTIAFMRTTGATGFFPWFLLCGGIVWLLLRRPLLGPLLLIPAIAAAWLAQSRYRRRRLRKYMPAIAQVEGGGIKRGLTAPEAAALLELPINKVLTLMIFGLLKKGVLQQVQASPLQVRTAPAFAPANAAEGRRERVKLRKAAAQDAGIALFTYEQNVLDTIRQHPDKPLEEIDFTEDIKSFLVDVGARMKGFDLSDTQEYYRHIVKRAVEQASVIEDIREREAALDRDMEWILMDENAPDVFTTSTWSYDPVWTRPSGGSGGGSISLGGSKPASAPSFGDVARGFAGWSENTAGSLAAAISPGGLPQGAGGIVNLSGIDRGVSKALSSASSGSSSSGGGGCACACAGCACACACAGGGR